MTSFNKPAADSLLQLYSAFIKKYPGDSLTRRYIFKAGNLYMTEGNGKSALEMFDNYMTTYPQDPKTPVCLFFKAFIYETIFNNLDKAQETYILFLEKYPRHELANDAKMSLNNLGKTPDQIVPSLKRTKRSTAPGLPIPSGKQAGRKGKAYALKVLKRKFDSSEGLTCSNDDP